MAVTKVQLPVPNPNSPRPFYSVGLRSPCEIYQLTKLSGDTTYTLNSTRLHSISAVYVYNAAGVLIAATATLGGTSTALANLGAGLFVTVVVVGQSSGGLNPAASDGLNPPAPPAPVSASQTRFAGSITQPTTPFVADWSDLANVGADDGAAATCSLGSGGNGFSEMASLSDFGFSIPDGATITGVVVTVKRASNLANAAEDMTLRLEKSGASGQNKAAVGVYWPQATAAATYGGESDLWELTFTPAEVNDAAFGLSFRVKDEQEGFASVSVDFISITVHYTTA